MVQKQNTHGFSVIELVILLAVLGILTGLGFVAHTMLIKAAPTASAQDLKAAQSTVQAFYAAYTNSQGRGAEILQQYGTSNLLADSKTGSKNFSPIVCGQNVAPVSTGTPAYANGRFDVKVTMRFSPPLTFTAEVVKDGSEFKIDKVDCPAPKGGE